MKKTASKNADQSIDMDTFFRELGVTTSTYSKAIKNAYVHILEAEMKKKGITKSELARRMDTSRSMLDRLFKPHNDNVTLKTLVSAGLAIGKHIRITWDD